MICDLWFVCVISDALLTDAERTPIESDPELIAILKEERTAPLSKMCLLVLTFAVVLLLNVLKGGGAFASPLGIQCGSLGFWSVTMGMFLWLIVISLYVRNGLVQVVYFVIVIVIMIVIVVVVVVVVVIMRICD